jgi:hypothetical protein
MPIGCKAVNITPEVWMQQLPLPPPSRSIPHARIWSITFRTMHILAICILVGGHAFNAPADQLRSFLYVAILSGIGMASIEAYPSFQSLFQGWSFLLLFKLALLCVIPFAWNHRLPILVAVVIIGSVGSHMSKRLRHYSFLHEPELNKTEK